MRISRLVAICLGAVSALLAQSLPMLYRQALAPVVEGGQVAAIEQVHFHRDALQFILSDGFLALTAPVAGHITAAVFNGHGTLIVVPPTAAEQEQVRRFLGQPQIELPFSEAVFRFPDVAGFAADLGSQVRFQPNPRGASLSAVIAARARWDSDRASPDPARILEAVFGPDPEGDRLFLADLKSTHFGWVQADFDPRRQEEVEVHRYAQSPITGLAYFDDVWTRFAKSADLARGIEAAHKHPERLKLDDFRLEVTVPHDLDMQESASFNLDPLRPAGRGIFLALDSNLRVTAAQTASGLPVAWIQPRDPGRVRPPEYRGDWLYLQLPARLAAPLSIRLQLHGKYIIQRVGDGNYFARSMGWYPLYPFGAPLHYADYDLVFHCAKQDSVVATGERIADSLNGKIRTEEFRSTVPLTVAGFALGQYRERSQTITLDGRPTTVSVFTNTRPDDQFAEISSLDDLPGPNPAPRLLPGLDTLNPLHLQPLVLQEVANSLRFFDFFFGPYPYRKLAVVNIPGAYGQGWPSLLYLSSLSFLDSTQLHDLGASLQGLRQLSQTFRAHETSHQWWGHKVTWASYRDQWLSEGFANASALLYENARYGPAQAHQTLEEWRRDLLSRNRFGHAPIDEGALWLGNRLASSLDPFAYQTVVYDKGGYVLYMLRELMLDPRARQPDARFIAMMRDFTQTYSGRAASTADFEAVANRYMTPAMDLDGNHRLDWFFDEYVYGSGAPHVRFSYQVAPTGVGSRVTFHFEQQPSGWKELLPVYVHFGKHREIRGMVRLRGADETVTARFPLRVTSAVANEFDDVLAVITH